MQYLIKDPTSQTQFFSSNFDMINPGGGAFSSPEIARSSHAQTPTDQDAKFEGIGAHVKLLLKLVHEQSHASNGELDDRRTQRVPGMITILDDVKTRIQKYSPPVGKSLKEFRRCNTDLRPHRAPRDNRSADVVIDEEEKLRREAACKQRSKEEP
ncbi:uncharacterized protein LOC111282980 [Durio zibethinus]|uniref:Uncharacterized protein LOC111282980 n=1 Tax=Durio zibethinus TaxID=66656 RepID=A0A6P5XFK4_DURZI|nr:uncharacterized protein LOC111282980 [Durio zibethinus]